VTTVLAIDPGGTCGMACVPLYDGPFDPGVVVGWQMPADECVDWCHAYTGQDWLVLMERFFITATTAQLSPEGSHATLDVIGSVRHLCRRSGAGFKFQTSNDAKKFVSNPQLRELGLWRPNEDHARDALRHLVYGLVHSCSGRTCEDLKQRLAGS
jgi:hypothetical protein